MSFKQALITMIPLFLAIGLVGALVGRAIAKASGPSTKPEYEHHRLEVLKLRKVLTLDQAEDGLVLARRYKDKNAEVKFALEVVKLRKKRIPI